MQVNAAGVTEPPIQSDEAVEELANEDPAPTPLRRQGTRARQPTKRAAEPSTPLHHQGTRARQPTKRAAEASATQSNTKRVRRV